jgi:hypothetical protein
MSQFATSKIVYRELRAALEPVLDKLQYYRAPKQQAAWVKDLDATRKLMVSFRVSAFGSAATGGNDLHGEIEITSSGSSESSPADAYRRADLTRCFYQPELNELRSIQAEINARRPITTATARWLGEPSTVGDSTRAEYTLPDPVKYSEGRYVSLSYFTTEDVQALIAFLARHLPAALERFAEDRCPPPVFVELPEAFQKRDHPPAG